MTDVSQVPYGDEGDARPVSLIGARIPAPTPDPASTTRDAASVGTAVPPGPGGAGASGATGRLTSRRRRRLRAGSNETGADETSSAAGHDPRQVEAFMLGNEGTSAAPNTAMSDGTAATSSAVTDAGAAATTDRSQSAGSAEDGRPTTAAAAVSDAPSDPLTGPVRRPDRPGQPDRAGKAAGDEVSAGPVNRPTAAARSSGRPSAQAPRLGLVPPPPRSPSPPKPPSAVAPAVADSRPQDASAGPTTQAGPTAPAPQPAVPAVPAAAQPVVHVAPQSRLPDVPQPGSRELWPWQEPWHDLGELEAWEEIPIRESLCDRVGAPLRGSYRIAVTSLIGGSGRTTVTAMLGLTFARIRSEAVVALDISAGVENTVDSEGVDADTVFGASLAERVGLHPSATISDLVADSISYRARRGGASRPIGEIRWLINGAAEGPSSLSAAAGLDVLPAHRAAGSAGSAADRTSASDISVSHPSSPPATASHPAALVPAGMPGPLTPEVLSSAFRALERIYPLNLVDNALNWDEPLASLTLRDADVVVLVVPALPGDLAEASAVLRDPTGLLRRHPEGSPVVIIAAISVRPGRWSPQTRSAAAKLGRRVDAMVRIPYDPRLDNTIPDRYRPPRTAGPTPNGGGRMPHSGTPIPYSRLRWRTRRAFLRLAATVVDACRDADLNSDSDDTATTETSSTRDLPSASGVSSDDLRADLIPGREQQ